MREDLIKHLQEKINADPEAYANAAKMKIVAEKVVNRMDAVNAAHRPNLMNRVGNVVMLWEDGEINMTKSGPGLSIGSRTLFILEPKHPAMHFDMPAPHGPLHSYCMVETEEQARELRRIILNG